jgi:predicted kinase/predicted phosphodiesterase
MKTLVLTKGAPGSGKSSTLKMLGWEKYVLEPDSLRILLASPVYSPEGKLGISQRNDGKVWELLFNLLESRMENGEFVVIDATHSKNDNFNRYKALAERYGYRIYLIDFTKVPLATCLDQNKQRDPVKQVPEHVIQNHYKRFADPQLKKIPNWIKVYEPLEATRITYTTTSVDDFEKVFVIGDVHGCYDQLMEFYKLHEFSQKNLYIFVGDYIDRGPNSLMMLKFIKEALRDFKFNFIFLEGNHEKNLRTWAHTGELNGQFKDTYAEIKDTFSQSDIRQMTRNFSQISFITFKGRKYLISHGGVSSLTSNILFTSHRTFQYGTGNYADVAICAETWSENNRGIVQIHGHRNVSDLPTCVNPWWYCLEGGVERGGSLRILELGDKIKTIDIKNENYTPREKAYSDTDYVYKNIGDFVTKKPKRVSNRAIRGLWYNKSMDTIVARGFGKFFNYQEIAKGLDRLKYPLYVYKKENGFLLLVSYYNGKLEYFTKNNRESEYTKWGAELLEKHTQLLKDFFLKYPNTTLLFEVIKHKEDPHIVDASKDDIVLLDCIKNEETFSKISLDDLRWFFLKNIKIKEFVKIIDSRSELDTFIKVAKDEINTEGYVVEDSNGYIFKVKTEWYFFWKKVRNWTPKILKEEKVVGYTQEESDLINWLKKNKHLLDTSSIPQLRNLYEKESLSL